ncbi:hypothetical protein ElyMa_005059600 [Elysia marginata]|uniref:Transposase n=1 Tax=Elysia marginata TaxID=1093978 RepID=A0AAV4JE62_9GAST|nr:hypothetical protein ElyMa_005059600 [Elysia marginata]
MPRTYKRKNDARRYKDYTTETLELAVRECADLGRLYAEVAAQYSTRSHFGLYAARLRVYTPNQLGARQFSAKKKKRQWRSI